MANPKRERAFYHKNGIPSPKLNIFFYNKELVKVIQKQPTTDTIYLYYYHSGKTKVASYIHFQQHKRRAWSCYECRKIIGRSQGSWERYLVKGMIPRPSYAKVGNVKGAGIQAYYSEDDLYIIRDAIAEIRKGGPIRKLDRKHPRPGTTILTKAELRAKIGDGRMLYVQNDEGEFVPVWSTNY